MPPGGSGTVAAITRNLNMESSLAEQDRALTILRADLPAQGSSRTDASPAVVAKSDDEGPARSIPAQPMPKTRDAETRRTPTPRRTAKRRASGARLTPDTFYKDLVWNLRNGVVAVTRDGRVAVMNEVAYQILGLRPRPGDIGASFLRVLHEQPEVARIIASAFELSHLPNRAELRLKSTGKVIGYTLSQVRDSRGRLSGATLFFKDLTRVEQLEERERLRDRLAALGEMAAAIAHEVKNPLAGIEVMAGILKRQLPDSQDAQTILGDII